MDSEYLDTAVNLFQERLEKGEWTEVSLRSGFDISPHQPDFRKVLDALEDRYPEWSEGEYEAGHLRDFVDRHIDEDVYVDWSLTGFSKLDVVEEEVYGYTDGDTLVLRVHEQGAVQKKE